MKVRFSLIVLFLCLVSCRSSKPPLIEICILDSFGGADCVEANGEKIYRPPSELTNYWATNQSDQAKFVSWCYQTNQALVDRRMEDLFFEMRSAR